ncbi:MAG: hypothetical protein Q4G68_05845 [Planctomycetia bacterium]|nr:hypothetical protein [Planctomycetia bacterium]
MKILISNAVILFTSLLICSGCGNLNQPEGFPKTASFTLTVTKGGTPLADADVTLFLESGANIIVGGKTDANGVANLTTVQGSYREVGVPEGTFKVVVNKAVDVPGAKSREEINELSPMEAAAYRREIEKKKKSIPPVVPVKYTTFDETPLLIAVTKGGATTIDVDD